MGERPILSISPAMQGGSVCIHGTRIPAEVIGGCVFAGDSVDAVADGYQLDRQEVLLACWWYVRERYADRKVRRRWGSWYEQAHLHFAQRLHPDKLDDPPRDARSPK